MDRRGLHGRWRQDQLGLPRRPHRRRREAKGDRLAREAAAGRGEGELPAPRLGDQPPTLLGSADPSALLRGLRHDFVGEAVLFAMLVIAAAVPLVSGAYA